jgi:hypothetical protein
MLHLAIYDYTEGLPDILFVQVSRMLGPLVEALIDDQEVRADAMRELDEVDQQSSK